MFIITPLVAGESLLMALKDVALSSGSACTSASLEPSYVLRAIGAEEDLAHSSIRFGIGRFTTEAEVEYTADKCVEHVKRLREMRWESIALLTSTHPFLFHQGSTPILGLALAEVAVNKAIYYLSQWILALLIFNKWCPFYHLVDILTFLWFIEYWPFCVSVDIGHFSISVKRVKNGHSQKLRQIDPLYEDSRNESLVMECIPFIQRGTPCTVIFRIYALMCKSCSAPNYMKYICTLIIARGYISIKCC